MREKHVGAVKQQRQKERADGESKEWRRQEKKTEMEENEVAHDSKTEQQKIPE